MVRAAAAAQAHHHGLDQRGLPPRDPRHRAQFPIKTRPYLLQGGYMKFMAWNPQHVTNHLAVPLGELDWNKRKRRQRFWNKMLLEKRKLEGDRLEVERRVEKEFWRSKDWKRRDRRG